MSNKKSKKNNIKVLQNITFKVASDGNSKTLFSPEERNLYYGESLICKRACLDENSFKTDCTAVDYVHNSRVRRYTASVLVFDEEPVFSDSDEEKEYNKRILETHKIETTSNQTSKKSSVEVQCDIPLDDKKYLLPDELKYDREISEVQKFGIISSQAPNKVNVAVQCNILLDELKVKEFVKLFANSDFENVPEDFKQLVVLCRQLLYKWNPSPSPSKRNVSCNSNDNVTNTQLFQQQPETIRNVEDPKLHSTSNEFLPSKSNNGVNDFTSESFNTDENIFSSSQIVDIPDQNGSFTENNWVRRSTRQRRSKNNSKIIVDTPKTNKRNLRSNKPNVESKDTAENIFYS
ncbi:hypothetical protein NQ314_009006 [Rhamnusium bicolor]|uniref:Uncharacterized protein n=1 Tax=Rhamnusium bicolor TaxID=1586634 RepID=A0AAV8Y4S0_9CUCU|nr:hypothetical protein NQ314_009006 [Rhamnusium bicolor]